MARNREHCLCDGTGQEPAADAEPATDADGWGERVCEAGRMRVQLCSVDPVHAVRRRWQPQQQAKGLAGTGGRPLHAAIEQ